MERVISQRSTRRGDDLPRGSNATNPAMECSDSRLTAMRLAAIVRPAPLCPHFRVNLDCPVHGVSRMRRKSLWLSLALIVAIVGSVLTTLAILTQHEPSFYRRGDVSAGDLREVLSGQLFNK